MKKVVVLVLISLFFGCNKKEDSEVQKPYVISELNKPTKATDEYYIDSKGKKKSFPPPPPPQPFLYGTNVFVLDRESNIYYYQTKKILGFICGGTSGNFDYYTIPEFINLQPENIIQIPDDNISNFVKLNLRIGERNRINIASQRDTLKSENYFNLKKAVDKYCNYKESDVYIIRRTTQEEDTILTYVGKDKYYNSDSIKWDKSRIKFPNQVKFTKP